MNRHASVDSNYRHGSTVRAATNTERTIGASIRQGWRLSCGAAERAAHNAVATRNDAAYAAYPDPALLITATEKAAVPAAAPLTRTVAMLTHDGERLTYPDDIRDAVAKGR